MVNKALGYLIAVIGLIGLFLSVEDVAKGFPVLSSISSKIILYPAMAITAVGIVIIIASSSGKKLKQEKEVPIFHGKKIVGYRRH